MPKHLTYMTQNKKTEYQVVTEKPHKTDRFVPGFV